MLGTGRIGIPIFLITDVYADRTDLKRRCGIISATGLRHGYGAAGLAVDYRTDQGIVTRRRVAKCDGHRAANGIASIWAVAG